jgi:hypothetical protein
VSREWESGEEEGGGELGKGKFERQGLVTQNLLATPEIISASESCSKM